MSYLVALSLTQPFIALELVKSVQGTPGELFLKSKVSFGSVNLSINRGHIFSKKKLGLYLYLGLALRNVFVLSSLFQNYGQLNGFLQQHLQLESNHLCSLPTSTSTTTKPPTDSKMSPTIKTTTSQQSSSTTAKRHATRHILPLPLTQPPPLKLKSLASCN